MDKYSVLITFKDTTTLTISNVQSLVCNGGGWIVKSKVADHVNVSNAYTYRQLDKNTVSSISLQVAS